MSTDDNIFLATDRPLAQVGSWLGEVLGLESVDDPELKDDAYLFRGRARTVAGELYLLLEPNVYGEADPEPEDISAIDRYQGVVDVRYAGRKDEDLQEREARAIFDELCGLHPDLAMVLSHNMALMTAAYLPGAGKHDFPRDTTLDIDHSEVWRPWVAS
jgi:hypothetical protein